MGNTHVQPHVQILEQPVKFVRFRYESEKKWVSNIPGVNSTPKCKTFPSIRIVGYKGCAKVVVSCVTKDPPYIPHPHSLVGKEVCKQGICTVKIPKGNMDVIFSNQGVQCVQRKDVEEALKVRQELQIDPFKTGFKHPTNIDLNAVRLCFEVYLEDSQEGIFNKQLDPIVSDPIYHEKTTNLVICKLSHYKASVAGSQQMILLCEKINKQDIKVRFFEERKGKLVWETFGHIKQIHKQVAIVFWTPKYYSQKIIRPVEVCIQLQRPSDNATSKPQLFEMLPLPTVHKRPRSLELWNTVFSDKYMKLGGNIFLTDDDVQPYAEILKQPAKFVRFRYKSEEKWISNILGVDSTPKDKTFPSIRIERYKGRAKVVVSCVTKDPPYRPHPHGLVGMEVCKQGICTVEVLEDNMDVIFSNLGIQCVKVKDIEEALKMRRELQVDPFGTGFEYPTSIDLNVVRLCFEVYLEGSQKGIFNKRLDPIVSDPIYHEKARSNLEICELSHSCAPFNSELEMILLCDQVDKKDIKVRFFGVKDGQLFWEEFGQFQPTHVHKQVAIIFKTPKYHSLQRILHPVHVYVQLQRPSDSATSKPKPFSLLPLDMERDPTFVFPLLWDCTPPPYTGLESEQVRSLPLKPLRSPVYVPPKPTSFPNDNCNDNKNHTVPPIYVSDQSYQPELNLLDGNGTTSENQAVQPRIMFDSAEISNILEGIDIDFDVNSTDLTDVLTNLFANDSELITQS